jgi:hypothetical protein
MNILLVSYNREVVNDMSDKRIYSTGPLENTGNNRSVNTITHVLNNHEEQYVKAKIEVYGLDGTKTKLEKIKVRVAPHSNSLQTTYIPDEVVAYEVRITVYDDDDNKVLVGTFGRDINFNQNINHIVHSEFTRIDD